jgi:hypothetical protein
MIITDKRDPYYWPERATLKARMKEEQSQRIRYATVDKSTGDILIYCDKDKSQPHIVRYPKSFQSKPTPYNTRFVTINGVQCNLVWI